MSLQSTLAEIKKVKPLAEEDTSTGPVETLNARRGRKNQAVESLKRLKREYKKGMLETAMFIIAVGSTRNELVEASKEHGIMSANPNDFYVDLSGRVPETLYMNKTGVSNIFEVLGRHLEDKMNELDLLEYNQLIFKAQYAKEIRSKEDFADLIRLAVNSQIGSEIVGIQAVESLVNQAIESGHSATFTPIMLAVDNVDFANDLVRDLRRLTDHVFVLGSGELTDGMKSLDGINVLEDTSKKSVKAALTAMKKTLKK